MFHCKCSLIFWCWISYFASASWKYHMKASYINFGEFWSAKLEQWHQICQTEILMMMMIICKEIWAYYINILNVWLKTMEF